VSYAAIAAALALGDVSPSERLVAFSLASYANRDGIAYPGNPAAAARAGLSRSRYLHARDQLQRRGLVSIAEAGGGRGRSTSIALAFAGAGPRFEGPVNAELFEAVLGYSKAGGAARQLLAAMAAMSGGDGSLTGITTDEIRAAGGLADSTYRRARAALLESGELLLGRGGGGRGVTNEWWVRDPREGGVEPAQQSPRRRVAPPAGARPLVASVPSADAAVATSDAPAAVARKGPDLSGVSGRANTGQSTTPSARNGPDLSGVSAGKGAQSRTVSLPETPPETPPKTPSETPPETPPPNVRAGKEPGNQGTSDPPTPLAGGTTEPVLVSIKEDYVTDRGRKRQRTVTVDLAAIRAQFLKPTEQDHADWHEVRSVLGEIVGESTFEIWLAQLELAAVGSAGELVVCAPPSVRSWISERFDRAFDRAGRIGRPLRLADEHDERLLAALDRSVDAGRAGDHGTPGLHLHRQRQREAS
jgi:hypothetical protein